MVADPGLKGFRPGTSSRAGTADSLIPYSGDCRIVLGPEIAGFK